MNKDELENCPCCNSSRVGFVKGSKMDGSGSFWKAYCKVCQIRTWDERTKKAAIAVWNKRVERY